MNDNGIERVLNEQLAAGVEPGECGERGNRGDRGEPGPCFYKTEWDGIVGVLSELESAIDWDHPIKMGDGNNHHVSVDAYALSQAVDMLYRYRDLLTQPLNELVSPYFYHHCRATPRMGVRRGVK